MATAARRQDLPPPSGYKPINFKRIPAKSFFSGWALIGGYLGMTAGAAAVYFFTYSKVHNKDIEQRSSDLALFPLLLAERDREFLKQLRRNRDEEASLMANVEGWKVGTYYGQPIYKTKDANDLILPTFSEYYIHTDLKSKHKQSELRLWS